MADAVATHQPPVQQPPVHRLTVLYDADCPLCAHVRKWLAGQRRLVPLDFVPAGSDAARQRFPELDPASTLAEITVVGDGGQLYRGPAAWIVCLWALASYRPLAHRLSTPAGARLAKGAVVTAAKWREAAKARVERDRRWGGGTYRSQDGWRYDTDTGWSYDDLGKGSRTGPGGCADDACASG
ncbi:thiol-disulfide oxidoreductase DCC family protein [Streptomyces sp. NPDC091292]|uniref:thiol-disulfide oxidoreductase DCC family protein n=1 Tax=Streptomyces sp. NPDC091292 TaxID=3365991 RepID=UPI0037FBE5D7